MGSLEPQTKFGLLIYTGTGNLGDEIQSLAARQFLPQVDYFFDRDALFQTDVKEDTDIKVIMNGWYFKTTGSWPPPPCIKPLLTSFHITPAVKDKILSSAGIEYFKKHEIVGARDLFTLDLFQKAGVRSFFSGCLTLTLLRPQVSRDDDLIVLNDLRPDAINFVKDRTDKKIMLTWHGAYHKTDPKLRSRQAQKMLDIYASASCVVTTRLHCALPCLAMQTPVLLLDIASDQERFAGIHDFVHHARESRLLNREFTYDFANPPPNPQLHLPYREALIAAAQAFVRAG